MSKSVHSTSTDNSEASLYTILKNCANNQSVDSLTDDFGNGVAIAVDYHHQEYTCDYYKMISTHNLNIGGCEDTFVDNILEENGRISLAYENLKTIPKRIAEKFAAHTKCLDLSYNNFQNLSFLSFFEGLHTLILDRNSHLDVNSLPFLPNLKILWINNCEIMNISDWIHRIQLQCPSLQHLSIMGNPGIRTLFNFSTLTSKQSTALPTIYQTITTTDYREFVFNILPNLLYLDGIEACPSSQSMIRNNNTKYNTTIANENGRATTAVAGGDTAATKISTDNNLNRKPSPVNFIERFRLKRRKKSYQSSSTN